MKRHIVLIGAPGSGKGTISKLLTTSDSKYHHISTGDLLRAQKTLGTALGIIVKEKEKTGSLVPTNIIEQIVENEIDANLDKTFVFDGVVRKGEQLDWLFRKINSIGDELVLVFINVDTDTAISRLQNRAKTSGRLDDSDISIIENRLQIYSESLSDIATTILNIHTIYGYNLPIIDIDGWHDAETVWDQFQNTLELE